MPGLFGGRGGGGEGGGGEGGEGGGGVGGGGGCGDVAIPPPSQKQHILLATQSPSSCEPPHTRDVAVSFPLTIPANMLHTA